MIHSAICLRSHKLGRSFSILTFILALISFCGIGRAEVSSVTPCSLTSAEAAGIDVDTTTDVHAIPNYKNAIYAMLKARRFRQLDCLADSARRHKEMFSGGMWKLQTMYVALREPRLHPTQEDWRKHMHLVQEWVGARPRSITARVVLAETYVSYGWNARGEGESDTVSNSGWKLFEQRVAEARKTLNDTSRLTDKCPEWFLAMQMVALAQGWSGQARVKLLEEAVSFEPRYFYYYRTHAASILPKWYGQEGEVEEFAKVTADRIGGDPGDVTYFWIAEYMLCRQTDDPLKFSWLRIQRGFKALEKQSGSSLQNWNYLARIATIYSDALMANRMFARIGEQWDEETWRTSSYFKSTQEWAKQVSLTLEKQRETEDAAEVNLATPEGQQYQVVIEEKLKAAIPGCVKTFGRDNGKFEVLFKIDQDGYMREMTTAGFSRVGFCVVKNAAQSSQQGKPSLFPKPPKGDYWVRFDLDLDSFDSTAQK